MNKIITISREYGSGGRKIGALIANKLGIPMYDREIIDMAARESGLSREIIETAELRAKNNFSYTLSSAMNYTDGIAGEPISMNEKLFLTQFDVVTEIGEKGDCVIVGRCADFVLRDFPGITSVFLYASKESRMKRCVDEYGLEPSKVKTIVETYDKARKNYYNFHTSRKWGDYRNYDLSINTEDVSCEDIAEVIIDYIDRKGV